MTLSHDFGIFAKRDAFIGEYEQLIDLKAKTLCKSAIHIWPATRAWVRDMLLKGYSASFDK